jgi:hypothetical protein
VEIFVYSEQFVVPTDKAEQYIKKAEKLRIQMDQKIVV